METWLKRQQSNAKSYCSNRRTGVLSGFRMCYIRTKYYCRYIADQWNSPTYRIQEYGISSPHLISPKLLKMSKLSLSSETNLLSERGIYV